MPSAWKIECQCPQCGAPVLLEETDHLFACAHCRVRLYIAGNGPLSSYLPSRAGRGRDILYAPYWWFRGTVFSCGVSEVRHRTIDLSILAFRHPSFPLSVGIRTQTQRLRYVTPDTDGVFLKTGDSQSEGVLRMWKQIGGLSSRQPTPAPSFSVFMGEGPGLLYAPFFVERGVLFDAVLGRSLGRLDPLFDLEEKGEHPGSKETGASPLRFLPVLCPDCGNDLSGEKESVILFCRGCASAWRPSRSGFKKIAFGSIPAREEGMLSLPFWRMRIAHEDLGLASYADLVHMANLPILVDPSWKTQPCHMWFPAFQVNPSLFLRLTRQMTLSLLTERMEASLPLPPVHPVTLRSELAAESVRVHLSSMAATNREAVLSRLPGIHLDPVEETLVYVPFLQKGGDLIHDRLHFSIPRAALTLQTPWA